MPPPHCYNTRSINELEREPPGPIATYDLGDQNLLEEYPNKFIFQEQTIRKVSWTRGFIKYIANIAALERGETQPYLIGDPAQKQETVPRFYS